MKCRDSTNQTNQIRNLDKHSTPYFGILRKAMASTSLRQLTISPEYELFNLSGLIVSTKQEPANKFVREIPERDLTERISGKSLRDHVRCCTGLVVKRNPYVIMNSLTSEQIRRLISTSYNSLKNMDKVQKRLCLESRNEVIPATKSETNKPKKAQNIKKLKNFNGEQVLQRLLRPTQASLSRQATQVFLWRSSRSKHCEKKSQLHSLGKLYLPFSAILL